MAPKNPVMTATPRPRRGAQVLCWSVVGAVLALGAVSVRRPPAALLVVGVVGIGACAAITRGRGALAGLPAGAVAAFLTVFGVVYVHAHGLTLPVALLASSVVLGVALVLSVRTLDRPRPGGTGADPDAEVSQSR